MNILKYNYFYEFTDAIVVAELKSVIKGQNLSRKTQDPMFDKAVLDAAKVLLRYYS